MSAQQEGASVNHSFIAYTVQEKDLLPESIAFDPVKENFYIGSTRKGKVLRISSGGQVSEFIAAGQDGLWMTIGLKVDPERRLLWVCSTGGDNLIDYSLKDDEDGRPAGIFKYHLDTGVLIEKYTLEEPGAVHFFNDLCIAQNGDVYATHMFAEHAVYRIRAGHGKLEKVFSDGSIRYPNGVTLSDDDSKLFVAHAGGISRIDLRNNEIKPLETAEGINITGRESIDGIYFYENTLIALQPDINTLLQLALNEEGTKITGSTLLEVNHPMMRYPTTGEIVGKEFYYIANAQFGSFNADGSLYPMEKLYEPIILKLTLGPKAPSK